MSVFHLKFSNSDSESYIGGEPLVSDISQIPMVPHTNEKQVLLLTLSYDFFKIPILKEDEVLSIFISCGNDFINITRALAVNDNNQSTNLKGEKYATVLIHKKSSPITDKNLRVLPKSFISTEPFTPTELKEETSLPGSGSEYSKLNGIPGWLQDNVFIEPKYQYWLQLNESDLVKISKEYENLFRDGIGYLFLNRNIKKMNITFEPLEAGIFFIQFT